VLSQVMLAVPLWLLYELGIVMAVFVSRSTVAPTTALAETAEAAVRADDRPGE